MSGYFFHNPETGRGAGQVDPEGLGLRCVSRDVGLAANARLVLSMLNLAHNFLAVELR